jgi:pantoate--beta-alanine ligase
LSLAVVEDLASLRGHINAWRDAGERIGLVPTMGNLHAGHLKLVDAVKPLCQRTVASIFVNPTQFGPGEDYQSYPRTRQADLEKLSAAGCDLAWVPTVESMYPLAESFMVQAPDGLSNQLCGQFRPGHFDGVASVVLRLFNQVRPDLAMFGEKDFQQLLVIRRMVHDLALSIEIAALPTVRETDGLAMSSRNQYLEPDQRRVAPVLYQVLTELAAGLQAGENWSVLRQSGWRKLEQAGFKPQYLEWRSAEDLSDPQPDKPQRLLAAAHLGRARLIDNIAVSG